MVHNRDNVCAKFGASLRLGMQPPLSAFRFAVLNRSFDNLTRQTDPSEAEPLHLRLRREVLSRGRFFCLDLVQIGVDAALDHFDPFGMATVLLVLWMPPMRMAVMGISTHTTAGLRKNSSQTYANVIIPHPVANLCLWPESPSVLVVRGKT